MSDFDNAAFKYDKQFSYTCIGEAQRNLVWRYIEKLDLHHHGNLLEINCGTGEDAKRWKGQNKKVHATDVSPKMIETARLKFPDIAFDVIDILALSKNQKKIGQPDLIFSNFGGLNCLSPNELNNFFCDSADLLSPNGKLILVIMGKKCLWDKLFLIIKGRANERNRRNANSFLAVNVDGMNVKTWYYSPKEIEGMAKAHFAIEDLKPIGLFVPPSYLATYFSSKKRTLAFLQYLDRIFLFRFFANYADHYFIVLKKIG